VGAASRLCGWGLLPTVFGGDFAVGPDPLDLLVGEADLLLDGIVWRGGIAAVGKELADGRDAGVGQPDGVDLCLGGCAVRVLGGGKESERPGDEDFEACEGSPEEWRAGIRLFGA
jgi:hypothetical protein